MFKKTVAAIMLVVLVLAWTPVPAFGAGVVQVGTAQELAQIANQVNNGNNYANTTIELTQDIDISGYSNWMIIGNKKNRPFSGTFDGGNYTISGLTTNARSLHEGVGFFGTLVNATIKNVTITTSKSGVWYDDDELDKQGVKSTEYVGILAGQVLDSAAGQATEITNVTVKGTVNAARHDVGLMIGRVHLLKKNSSLIIDKCTAQGTLASTGGLYAGGLIGHAHFKSSSGDISIKNSKASVDITSKKSYSGGFVGKLDNYEKSAKAVIDNCIATGSVNGLGKHTGGFAGFVRGFTIKNCMSDAGISFFSSDEGLDEDELDDDFDDNENDEDEDDESKDENSVESQRSNVGGFVGRVAGKSTLKATFINCYATGNVKGAKRNVGGFMGRGSYAAIEACWATGHVEATRDCIGGFAGKLYKCVVERSYATGFVSTKGNRVGGFVGLATGSTNKITNCYAVGGVASTGSGSSRIGAFGGKVRKAQITNCYASGTVVFGGKKVQYAGSFIGWSGKNTKLADCYFDSTATGNLPMIGRQDSKATGLAVGLPTEKMIESASYAKSWKFTGSPWSIVEGETYPFLEHQWKNKWGNDYYIASISDSTGKLYMLPECELNNGNATIQNSNAKKLYFPYGPTNINLKANESKPVVLGIRAGVKYTIGAMSESNIIAFKKGGVVGPPIVW
ncbi:MAG: hypothetical protein FWG10_00730 [Eubacteriaceae bacterium]|nr:hypothetical protein [Eubacteriaceae bacterium]